MEESINYSYHPVLGAGLMAGIFALPIVYNLGISLSLKTLILTPAVFILMPTVGFWVAVRLKKHWKLAIQFVKFGISGGTSAMVDFGILNILIIITGLASGIWYSVFKAISTIFGIINSYLWNRHWTFEAKEGGMDLREFLTFFAFATLSFFLNVGIASFVVNVIGAPDGISEKIWANIGAAVAAIIVTLWNYVWMKLFVFKK